MSDDAAGGTTRPGARRAPRTSRSKRVAAPSTTATTSPSTPGGARRAGGARALRPARRRTQGLPGTLGMTLLGAVLPGSGYLYAGRKALGAVVLVAWLALIGGTLWYFGRDVSNAIDFALDPTLLKIAAATLLVGLFLWAFVVFTSYRLVRPRTRPRWHTAVGNIAVGVLCLAAALPATYATRSAMATADAVETVFEGNQSATTPTGVTKDNPWAGHERVNVLLLGGDGGKGRTGVRTDTVILASMNTRTGKTTLFSLPRNMMYAQFPEDSPLHDLYPEGYGYGSSEDDGFFMLNAVYGQIPARHPKVLGKSSNEGADAIKQAVSGSLGIPVDYYVLVNLKGFEDVVNAMGGVTVNINEPVAIQGNTDAGIPPVDYLEPGPSQHLDGFHALWFARGRYGSDDYERMDRQRCMIDALVEAANPANLLTRYLDLVQTGKEIVYTDIPIEVAPAFVHLALKIKDAKVKSVVFKTSEKFSSGDPDYDYVRETVQKALHPKPRDPDAPKPEPAPDTEDVCAYQPTGETVTATD